jgi:hypothetical protein
MKPGIIFPSSCFPASTENGFVLSRNENEKDYEKENDWAHPEASFSWATVVARTRWAAAAMK